MSTRAALLLVLLALACQARSPAIPVPGDRRVLIGTPPSLLLQQVTPVPDGNAARHQRLKALFQEVGCDGLEERWRDSSEMPHVLCTLRGESSTQIVVSANFDAPLRRSQHDNWSGAAMLPSLYRSVRVAPRRHTYVFVGFADEGYARAGSPAASAQMVARLPEEERQDIAALVGIQGLKVDVPAVWESQADPNLHLDLVSVSRSLELPVRSVDFHFVRNAAAPGSRAWGQLDAPLVLREPVRIPSLETPSILIGVADLNVGEYLDSYRLLAAYLSYLDQTLQARREMRGAPDANPPPASG